MQQAVEIVVFGSANMDLVVRQPRLPRSGETIGGHEFETVAGGKGLNQAIAAARAGARVEFVGAVGSDGFGVELRSALASDGVGVSALATVPGPSGIAQVSVTGDGENAIVVVPGANGHRGPLDERAKTVIRSSRFLMAQLERPIEVVREALAFGGREGVATVLTPAPAAAMELDLLDDVDILLLNAHESRDLTGSDDAHQAALALGERVGLVVITRGAAGALAVERGKYTQEISAKAVDAVDTTGAGDTFAGYFIAQLAAGADTTTALHLAGLAAAISVTRRGASTAIPTRAEVITGQNSASS